MKKNINEEIERIKSLFTEERLYGNLITEEEKNTENGDEDDPYSMSSAKKLKKDAKQKNITKSKD